MGGLCVPQPFITTSSVLLWVALLCLAPAIRSNGPPQAILTLEPPWFNVLRDDNVTLTCEGFQTPGEDNIEWFHNGTIFPNHRDSYTIPAVSYNDGGHYQCRTKQTALSNSVKLQVSSDWVLLQVERLEFNVGDSMTLRCHSWKNKVLHKVIYYHNNKALKYEYESFNYFVSQVNHTHSGTYFCTGIIGHVSHPSAAVIIHVQGGESSTIKVVIIVSVLVIVTAIIAAAILYYYKYKKPANTPLELGKKEVENSMSYSLLKHTDNPEEEISGPSP